VERWAKAKPSSRELGIKFLLEQGFKIPDLPKLEAKPDTETAAWPKPLEEAAFHGLAGRFVRLVAPHTEADEAALLFQFLATAGSALGRKAYYLVEQDRHYANINVAIVGNTAKGRKGTSYGRVAYIMRKVDLAWNERIVSGLSSGEGLIWAVRDPIMRKEAMREKGKVVGYQEVMVDEGISDKRLLVLESELASPLKVMKREGNTLSPVVRNAWDTGKLSTLTKNSPARATDAHISIIGHVTKTELLRHLDDTEMANGFANRFLFVCVRRSKALPFGGDLAEAELEALTLEVGKVLEQARHIERVTMADKTKEDWADIYAELSEAKPGLFGSLIARAEAQVIRLALIYALLDASSVIRPEHLDAAMACWDYCESSAKYLFGETLGDPMADEILKALKAAGSEGMSRTDIRDLFARNAKAALVDRALKALAEADLARSETKKTKGRPMETWYAKRF
jgi:hypothetical protein